MTTRRPDTRLERRCVYESAAAFIMVQHDRPLTLGDVARHSMTSTRQLQRVLREQETSFRQLLLRARMAHAVRLLETETRIGEIARAVGYPEASSFSKVFRSRYACTPSTWRERRRVAWPS